MARRVRIFVEGYAQHIFLRALSDIRLFREGEDYEHFLEYLRESALKYSVQIYGAVLCDGFVEFLLGAGEKEAISAFMQRVGRMYVRYYNTMYKRNGTLWEGRYRASLVEDDFVLDVLCSMRQASQKDTRSLLLDVTYKEIVVAHRCYKELGYGDERRRERFDRACDAMQQERTLFIQRALLRQDITGSESFVRKIEEVTGVSFAPKASGRPKKNQKKGRKMYKKLSVLDKKSHKNFKVTEMENLYFAKDLSFVPLLAEEVKRVARDFPVVISGGEKPSFIALVSLGGENLAINEDGKWISAYVPAFLRRYPFSLAASQDDAQQKIILIDEESSLFSKSKGKQLFKKSGENSELLDNAVRFLQEFDAKEQFSQALAEKFVASEIVEEREISVGEDEEKKVLVNGFLVVDREKLNSLSDDVLAGWAREGVLALIDAHIESLEHIQKLFELAMHRQNMQNAS